MWIRRRRHLEDASHYMYKLIYNYAEPSVDWDEIDKTSETFFMEYEIEAEDLERAIEETLKKFKLYKHEKASLRFTAYLGPSPKTKKRNVH